MAGVGAGVTLATTLAFSPLYRRWNTALTRRDVLRKAFASSVGAGCVGYAVGRQLQFDINHSEESYYTMRDVRGMLVNSGRYEFLELHPPEAATSISRSDNISTESPPPGIAEKILSACHWFTTTSESLRSMRAFLEQDLLTGGVSQHDANIVTTYLASGLDGNNFQRSLSIGLVGLLYVMRESARTHPRSALYRAPRAARVVVWLGDFFLLGLTAGFAVRKEFSSMAYSGYIRDKAAVAAVLREKFRKELETK
ncbi:uncharacterized protein B0H18DRAFT_991220 [Fomitopsis serialis]|uniref:uncharacterized protein n=1 Tax=Fomitopsis serialis TaxID=139415 RepID=UPI002007C091|nr:uncharacterized protein B0H18DRAFT_991220 [Neoantrodia serialis]KAH9931330.1 hypothetical protein B0H18DRAFT_991220 [Neoantrodia serialis]